MSNMHSSITHKLDVYNSSYLSRQSKETALALPVALPSANLACVILRRRHRELPLIEDIAVDLARGVGDSDCMRRPFLGQPSKGPFFVAFE